MLIICPPEVYHRIRAFFTDGGSLDIDDPAPPLTEYDYRLTIARLLRVMYEEDPDSCGPIGTEPRDTFDAGGSIEDGLAAMEWGD
ncbi:MAG: hypothetical protein GY820_39305 [Gammaproteobacteria bacterium]|nr:hypothetical protein [Gammaproteobacteria bacterium]